MRLFARGEIQTAPKHPQIVIGRVQNNFTRLQCLTQRFQIEIAQWVDNEIANQRGGRNADLHQAKFFPVRMQTVCLCIYRDPIGRLNLPDLSQRNLTRSAVCFCASLV